MTENIREVLSPLLIISYVCGLRVVEFPARDLKQRFSFLCILLLWSFYNFIMIYKIPSTANLSIEYHVCIGFHIFTTSLSIAIGIYYDKIFKSCIKKLTIVDDTLEKIGTTKNYHKIKIKIVWFVLGWFVIIIIITSLEIYLFKRIKLDIFIPPIRNYYTCITFIGDLTITIILGYIGLKFDQINKHLEKLSGSNKIMLTMEHPVCRRYSRFSKASKNKCAIWIIMHLHSELHKICRKIDFIFGIQMTFEIGCYFALIVACTKEILDVIFIKNYMNKRLVLTILLFWLFIYIFRLLLINYVCESVSTKANVTGDFINRFLYPSCDIEIRENVSQFLLQIYQSPIKFYGLGLFQFGFKFLYRFFASVLTVLIIHLQAHTNREYV